MGFLLHDHGKHASKIYFPPLVLGISELENFTGLGFRVALVDSAFGVYNVACSSFFFTIIGRFSILSRGCTITCNGAIASQLAI